MPIIFDDEPKGRTYSEEVREKAVRMYVEGNNLRRIGRLLSVNYQSIHMTIEDKNNLGVTQPVKVPLPVGQTAAPLWAVIIASSISLLVFVGWLFEVDFLKRIIPGYVFMNPTTAVAFILSSVSLWFLHSANAKLIRLAQACAGAVALIGLIKLCAIVGFFDIGIDQILFSDQLFDKVTEQPNRMAPTTALNFLLLGAALLLLNFETKRGRDSFPSQYLAIAVILSSFLAIIGYLYGAKSFYAIVSFNPMAIHTAVSFFALAVGLLLSKPERGLVKEILSRDIGGETARRLFPLVIIVPIVLGWLRLKGEHFGLFTGEIGTAMFVVIIILIFAVIVLNDARLMNVAAAKRKRAENELLKLGSIVESSGDAIISKTLNGIITSWNSGAERVFGYTAEEIVGQHIFKLFPLELTGEEAQILEKITRGERIEHYETVRVRKDGKHIPVSLTVSPVKEAGGNVIGISKIVRDITEQKKIEETLRQSELKFRSVAKSANDAIIAADSKGNIISWNNGAERIFGYTEEEISGASLTVLMPEAYREAHQNGMERHNATGKTHVIGKTVELKGLRKDNSEFPLELSLSSWTTEEGKFSSGIIRDITERKRTEEALEAAALRESALIKNAVDVICSIDAEGKFVTVSPASLKIFGYLPEELIGRKYIDLVVAEDVAKTNEVAEQIVSGKPISHFENLYRHKDGSLVHIMWSASWSENQQLMFCVAHNITERKLNEEKMEKFAVELQRSNSELQDFASVASHDLQEPLRKIQSFADELKINIGHCIEAEDLDTLERMIAAAGRMRNLINDLLAFSRITTMAKPFMPVDLNSLLKEVLSDLEVRTRDSGGQIEAGHLPTIDADPLQMRQLLQNLIGNGLKFHRAGVAPIIKISGTNGGAHCHLTIADNGIGFDEKYLDRIFTIFQRLHGRNEYEGTGIGLAICRKIVERHGGELTARSAVGEGATFIITLPVKQSKEEK